MPISRKGKKQLIQSLPLIENGPIFELGSGWGGLAFTLAKRYSNHKVYAYELSIVPWLISRIRQLFIYTPNLKIHRKDFFKVPLQGSSLIVCYLFPGGMNKLEKKFDNELHNAWVVSYVFSLPSWQSETIVEVKDLLSSKIYLYKNLKK